MRDNGASERHQNNALKAVIGYTKFIGENTTFYDINAKKQMTAYLGTKIKSAEEDPDKKWITTWNDKLHRIKHLFRWLYNQRGKQVTIPVSNWERPAFAKIKEKNTKRLRSSAQRITSTEQIFSNSSMFANNNIYHR